MKVDIKKSYRAKNGAEVRLFSDDGIPDCEIIGAVKTERGWESQTWAWTGKQRSFFDSQYDLVEVKPSFNKEVWLNIYNGEYGLCVASGYATKRDADYGALKSRFACISITVNCEEGEGL